MPIEPNITPAPNPVILPETAKTDQFTAGVNQGIDMLQYKHILHRVMSIGLMLWGLWGIVKTVKEIFFVYPHLPEVFAAAGYDTEVVRELAFKVLILSAESFATAAYGFGMMVKPGHAVKTFHHVIGILLAIASVAIRYYFEVDPELIEQFMLLK